MAWTRRSMWSKAPSSEVEKKSGWGVKRRGGKSDTNLFTVSSAKRGRGQNKAEKGGRAVGRSNDKFLGPRVPGSRVITQRCEEDPTIIDSSRANAASVHVATVFKLVFCQRWGRIWSLKGFGNFVLWIKRTKSDRICWYGSLTASAPWQRRMLPYLRQVPNMLRGAFEWQRICATGLNHTFQLSQYLFGFKRNYIIPIFNMSWQKISGSCIKDISSNIPP